MSDDDADPFEARLEFLQVLSKLSASQNSIQRAAAFAMRHKSLHDDLFSCIMEEMETKDLNTRLNLFYVVDSLCHISQKMGFMGYIESVQGNLKTLMNWVVPPGSRVNVAATKRLVNVWNEKHFFEKQILQPILDSLCVDIEPNAAE